MIKDSETNDNLEARWRALTFILIVKSYIPRAIVYSMIYVTIFGVLLALGGNSRRAPAAFLIAILVYPIMLWAGYKDARDRFFNLGSDVINQEIDSLVFKYKLICEKIVIAYSIFERHKFGFIFAALLVLIAVTVSK